MTQRTNKHIETFIEDINREWNLSLVETDFLETVFNLILAGKSKETADILNFYTSEEWENLLHRIPERDIKSFSRTWLKMLEESDIEDDITLKDFCNEDIKREFNNRGLFKKEEYDVVTEMQLDELVSNFLSADFEKRNKFLEL